MGITYPHIRWIRKKAYPLLKRQLISHPQDLWKTPGITIDMWTMWKVYPQHLWITLLESELLEKLIFANLTGNTGKYRQKIIKALLHNSRGLSTKMADLSTFSYI